MRHSFLIISATTLVVLANLASPQPAWATAMITVINLDGPDEGFNDPTMAAPVGGNPGTTIGQQRLMAFQHAANIWASLITSPVEIRVEGNFDPLSCSANSAVLGSAGPNSSHRNFAGAPVPSTWYVQALANSLFGGDLSPGSNDIGARFSSTIGTPGCLENNGWYYGLDASPPAGKIDFVTVLLHELGHGLGFLSLVNLSTGLKLNGSDDAYMRFLEDHSTGKLYPQMTDAERLAASTNTENLHWTGPNVVAGSVGLTAGRHPSGHVQMYAPNPAQSGSSVSHYDTTLIPNELMEPSYTGPLHAVGLTLELFGDLGWNISSVPLPRTPADFDGDGKMDIAVYRNGAWFIRKSSGGTTVVGWGGAAQDIPVQADYDGDGKSDVAIFRDGAWFIVNSSGGTMAVVWGAAEDILVPGDYDGDGKADLAVYRSGAWLILRSSDGMVQTVGWGGAVGDIPVPADYDGDGKTDVAIYRRGNGAWFIVNSGGGMQIVGWGGAAGDIPVSADYDGDGKTDVAVFRNGVWFIIKSSGGTQIVGWGEMGDVPIN